MKRLLVVLLILTIALSTCLTMTACGGDSGNQTPGGDEPGGDEPGGDVPGGDEPGGDTPGGDTPGGDEPGGDTPGGDEPGGDTPGGDVPGGDTPGGDEPGGEENPDEEATLDNVIDGVVYVISSDGTYAKAVGYVGTSRTIRVASEFKGVPVKEIMPFAFDSCKNIDRVIISEGVVRIGAQAFSEADGPISFTIPSTMKIIESSVFAKDQKIVEVINHSSLDIQAGSAEYGKIALNALIVHKDAESRIVKDENGFLFLSYESKNYLVGYEGERLDITLPENFGGEGYEIFPSAFARLPINSIIIPEGITAIPSSAFAHCTSLIYVSLPSTLSEIADGAFNGCISISEITNKSQLVIEPGESGNGGIASYAMTVNKDGSTLVRDGDFLFITVEGESYLVEYLGSDSTLVLPKLYNNSTYHIADHAFRNSEITSIVISSGVKTIGERAFYSSYLLTAVVMENGVEVIGDYSFDSCNALRTVTLPESLISIGREAFARCYGLIEAINLSSIEIIPGDASTNGSLGAFAQVIHNKQSVIENVEGFLFMSDDDGARLIGYIGDKSEVTLPEYYNGQPYAIYEGAFTGNRRLTKVTVPGFVTLTEGMFYNATALKEVVLLEGITEIPDGSFSECEGLVKITLPEGIEYIGEGAFEGCVRLSSIKLPASVTEIGEDAFYYCTSLSEVIIAPGVEAIGDYMFSNCVSLVSIVIPEGVTYIGESAFDSCYNLEIISLPSTLTKICDDAFYDCFELKTITLPSSITDFGEDVFCDCAKLEAIYVSGEGGYLSSVDGVLYGDGGTVLLVYPLRKSGDSFTVPEFVTEIYDSAFDYNLTIKHLNLPAGMTAIDSGLFVDLRVIETVSVYGEGGNLVMIDGVLYSDGGETLIYYPKTKTDTSFTIAEGVKTIAKYAFKENTYLESVIAPVSVTMIKGYAFYECTALKSITLNAPNNWKSPTYFGNESTFKDLSDDAQVVTYLTDLYRGRDFYRVTE